MNEKNMEEKMKAKKRKGKTHAPNTSAAGSGWPPHVGCVAETSPMLLAYRLFSFMYSQRSSFRRAWRGGFARQTIQYNAMQSMVLERKAFYDTYGVRTYYTSFVQGTHMRKKKAIYRMIKKVRREHQ